MERMEQLKAMLSLCLIFGVAFCLGSVVGHTVRVRDQAVMARPAQKDWGLSFQEDNKPPVADENMEQLAQYDAFYAENTTEKVLYLTFDCGYENGNTPAILDALKKHHVPAAFFIVGNYLEKNPNGYCQILVWQQDMFHTVPVPYLPLDCLDRHIQMQVSCYSPYLF